MKESFIDTISIENTPYIFRYELDGAGNTYNITVLNHREMEPFSMTRIAAETWRIGNEAAEAIKKAEERLCNAILSNNGN